MGFYLICDDIGTVTAVLQEKGVLFTEVEGAGLGLVKKITLPSGTRMGLYEPRHRTAFDLGSAQLAAPGENSEWDARTDTDSPTLTTQGPRCGRDLAKGSSMPRAFAVIVLAFLLPSACDASAPVPTFAERDSAGINIAESNGPRWSDGEGWTVDPVPVLDLTTSGTGPDHEFFRVASAAALSSGTIAVAEWDSNEIRFYSPGGEFISRTGGPGEGPGEFRRIVSLQPLAGDSLAVFDSRLARLTLIGPNRETIRVVHFAPLLLRSVVQLGNGSFVGRVSWPSLELFEGNREVLHREPVGVLRISADGEVMDSIAVAAGHDEFIFEWGSARSLFMKDSHVAVHRDMVFLGNSDRMEFRVFTPTGILDRIVRVPEFDLSISPEDIAREKAGWLGPNQSQERQDIVARIPVPETKPAYSSLHVDSEGNVWAEEYRQGWWAFTDDAPRSWTVFDSGGHWLGAVHLPPRFTTYQIGPDWILGLARDDLEVEQVRVLRLNKG